MSTPIDEYVARFGVPIIVTPRLPAQPSDGEVARRIVRHGLADVLDWLGEKVGPAVDSETHGFYAGGKFIVSEAYAEHLREMSRGGADR